MVADSRRYVRDYFGFRSIIVKAGDLVRSVISGQLGVVARVFMHKLWETDTMGKKVNWNEVEPQPFAEVAWSSRGGTVQRVPQKALEVVSEGR